MEKLTINNKQQRCQDAIEQYRIYINYFKCRNAKPIQKQKMQNVPTMYKIYPSNTNNYLNLEMLSMPKQQIIPRLPEIGEQTEAF